MRIIYCLPLLIILAIYLGYITKTYYIDTVDFVDLNKYQGTWYEIARLPNWFQRNCASDVTATYTLREDGTMEVINKCLTAEGHYSIVEGRAWLEDEDSKGARLEVSFIPILKNLQIFGSDYYILLRDIKYNYALVGTPNKKNLWILARERSIKEPIFKRLLNRAQELGYNVKELVRTQHAAPSKG